MTRHLQIRHRLGAYDVVVGSGVLGSLPDLLRRHCRATRYVVIADSAVAEIYGDAVTNSASLVARANLLTFPPGEASKTRGSWKRLTNGLLKLNLGRDSAVIALGGGVTGDLAGFTAATFMRGIPLVHIPTTTLAMIDSSVGGKTGVDTRHGKNLVGAFHQPHLVVADMDVLNSLPDEHLFAGLAEAMKHGAIADAEYFNFLVARADDLRRRDPGTLEAAVMRSIELKANVVSQDELEAGIRATLNFGHTIGHAIEASSRFAMLHGHAVSVGMVMETELGAEIGVTHPDAVAHLRQALTSLELPVDAKFDVENLLSYISVDKKNRDGTAHFSMISRIGDFYQTDTGNWTTPVEKSVIESYLKR